MPFTGKDNTLNRKRQGVKNPGFFFIGDTFKGLDPSKTFLNNKYKIEVGAIKYDNQYESYTVNGHVSAQDYHVGDPATGNVNAQMFGVLDLDEETLSYNVYAVNGETVKLFDSLDILKE